MTRDEIWNAVRDVRSLTPDQREQVCDKVMVVLTVLREPSDGALNLLRGIRKAAGFGPREFAERCGLSPARYLDLENGHQCRIDDQKQIVYDPAPSATKEELLAILKGLQSEQAALREPVPNELALPDSEGWWWEWMGDEWDLKNIIHSKETCKLGRWVKAIPPASPTPAGDIYARIEAMSDAEYAELVQAIDSAPTVKLPGGETWEPQTPIANPRPAGEGKLSEAEATFRLLLYTNPRQALAAFYSATGGEYVGMCVECGGDGFDIVEEGRGPWRVICPTCHGTGGPPSPDDLAEIFDWYSEREGFEMQASVFRSLTGGER